MTPKINKQTSTSPNTTWENYTRLIIDRLNNSPSSKETLFVAKACTEEKDAFIGYVAFYTLQDNIPYPSSFLTGDAEAYCSWTAVHPDFREKGIATQLKLQIFNPETPFTKFLGHIKKPNIASLAVLRNFGSKFGCKITEQSQGSQILYSVEKPNTQSLPPSAPAPASEEPPEVTSS
ncbi:MAG: GNAT family N-acetyltransferase [Verrucomicrobia bacterium]|nr:GNAT family N-acetyltransferase [Verrucomicrobiota bacterium]